MQAGGWLQGKTVRKLNSTTNHGRVATTVKSTSTTVFGGGVKDPSGRTSEFSSPDDQCPVCKSDRYLFKNLRLLVSSCYHKMCESCIDRLFTLGPAPCPICNTTLRKLGFTPQTFEDLDVEHEVAVRRRIAKEFNKRREDFDSLREYNDYLEDVENITFNLVNMIDVAETEAKMIAYRLENAANIEANMNREQQYAQSLLEREAAERRDREERAQKAAADDAAERASLAKSRQEIIEGLESGTQDAAKLIARSRAQAAKRASARSAASTVNQSNAAVLQARAVKSAKVPDVAHVPFEDDCYAYEDMYVVRDNYDDPFSEAVRRDREGIMRAGGYMIEEAWDRAIRTSVAGMYLSPLEGDTKDVVTATEP